MSNMGGLSELRHIRGTSRSFSGSYMMLNVTVTYKLIHKYHTIWFINKELNPPPKKIPTTCIMHHTASYFYRIQKKRYDDEIIISTLSTVRVHSWNVFLMYSSKAWHNCWYWVRTSSLFPVGGRKNALSSTYKVTHHTIAFLSIAPTKYFINLQYSLSSTWKITNPQE